MDRYSVKIIDGTASAAKVNSSPNPDFATKQNNLGVMAELMAREPLFHREEFGVTQQDYERMTDPDFWEVGASGRRYSRDYVIETLVSRHEHPTYETWHIEDFQCRKIADECYLATYTLFQNDRESRRSTIWRRCNGDWKIFYHQGTMVE